MGKFRGKTEIWSTRISTWEICPAVCRKIATFLPHLLAPIILTNNAAVTVWYFVTVTHRAFHAGEWRQTVPNLGEGESLHLERRRLTHH